MHGISGMIVPLLENMAGISSQTSIPIWCLNQSRYSNWNDLELGKSMVFVLIIADNSGGKLRFAILSVRCIALTSLRYFWPIVFFGPSPLAQ